MKILADECCSLAYAEINQAMAVMLRPNAAELSLFEIDESDIAQTADLLVPLPKLDSKGTRIRVK